MRLSDIIASDRASSNTLKPLDLPPGPSVFESKLDLFFRDFYSKDSLVAKRAREAIPNVYFGPAGVPFLLKNIGSMWKGTPLTSGLGYLKDFVCEGDSEMARRMRAAGLLVLGLSQ